MIRATCMEQPTGEAIKATMALVRYSSCCLPGPRLFCTVLTTNLNVASDPAWNRVYLQMVLRETSSAICTLRRVMECTNYRQRAYSAECMGFVIHIGAGMATDLLAIW